MTSRPTPAMPSRPRRASSSRRWRRWRHPPPSLNPARGPSWTRSHHCLTDATEAFHPPVHTPSRRWTPSHITTHENRNAHRGFGGGVVATSEGVVPEKPLLASRNLYQIRSGPDLEDGGGRVASDCGMWWCGVLVVFWWWSLGATIPLVDMLLIRLYIIRLSSLTLLNVSFSRVAMVVITLGSVASALALGVLLCLLTPHNLYSMKLFPTALHRNPPPPPQDWAFEAFATNNGLPCLLFCFAACSVMLTPCFQDIIVMSNLPLPDPEFISSPCMYMRFPRVPPLFQLTSTDSHASRHCCPPHPRALSPPHVQQSSFSVLDLEASTATPSLGALSLSPLLLDAPVSTDFSISRYDRSHLAASAERVVSSLQVGR